MQVSSVDFTKAFSEMKLSLLEVWCGTDCDLFEWNIKSYAISASFQKNCVPRGFFKLFSHCCDLMLTKFQLVVEFTKLHFFFRSVYTIQCRTLLNSGVAYLTEINFAKFGLNKQSFKFDQEVRRV